MKKTYIFGHKRPDTDAVTSAIALSYLKNQLGETTEARVLGSINKETSYALNYFKVKEPKYLNDVKLQIKDVKYHKGFFIDEMESIYDCYQAMLKEELTGIPIVSDSLFRGLVTLKNLSHIMVNEHMDLLDASFDNILKILKGVEINRCLDEIKGKILVAAYKSTRIMNTITFNNDNILIVGDRHSVIEYAINSKIKLIILSGDSQIKDEHLEQARKNNVNIIRSPYDSYTIARLIGLANYIKTIITINNPAKCIETDFVTDVLEMNNKLKHTNYPVVDKNNKCLGLLKITDIAEKSPKKVILVDHNEKAQSVEGIEEAEILEIFDHHNLGSITTNYPINFRNMSVGSTNTIVYNLYKEKEVNIPKDMAGLMLSGILSDTLILKSPTKTEKDEEAVLALSEIAGVDYQEYGLDLLKAATSLEGMSKEDVLYNDYKIFNVGDKNFAIGQFFTMNFSDIKKDLDEYIKVLDKVSEANNYSLVALYVTDIIENGSYIIFNKKAKNIIDTAYRKEMEEGEFIPLCVSRKKHIVPIMMETLEN